MNRNQQHATPAKPQMQPLSESEQQAVDGGFVSLSSGWWKTSTWRSVSYQSSFSSRTAPRTQAPRTADLISLNHNETLVEDAA